MKTSTFRVWFALFALAVPLVAEDIVLVDGRYLQVRVQEATETKVKVHLLDVGGEIWIPWNLIREDDRRRLRIRFGFEEDESEKAIFVDGVRVVTTNGDEYFGVPVAPLDVQSLPETFEIWTEGKKWPFTKKVVRSIESVQVPARDAYSREQLYEQKTAELHPAEDDIEAHWDLARFCMAIDYYPKAIEHLLKVRALDPEFESERLGNHLSRMEALARNETVAEAIRKAKQHVRDKRFDRARAAFADILAVTDLPPVLKAQTEQAREWGETKRVEHYKTVVRREYFSFLNSKVGKMARDPQLKLKDAQKELRSKLHKEIIADIAAKHGLDPKDEVQKWFEERVVHQPYVSSYGSGSFIVLGPAPGAKEREQQLQQAMARALAQQRSRQGRNDEQGSFSPEAMKFPKPPTADEWWTKYADSGMRADWMKAWFAEQCKMLKVVGERREDCHRCGARGILQFDGAQGEVIGVTCPTCQGHKFFKGVAYK